MSEDMFLGVKIQNLLIRFQEKLIDKTIAGEDTLDEVHAYRLFTDELRGLIKRWELRI